MSITFDGIWHNQHTSEMDLTVSPSGEVNGKYRTGVGAPTPSEEFDLIGFVSGDLISFTVNFGKYGSLTSWAGQLTINVKTTQEEIHTQWHLAHNVPDPDEPDKMWDAVTSGCDTFWRGPNLAAAKVHVKLMPSHPIKKA